jgi:Ca2+-binding EF-hand superfamily protein
MNMKRIAFLAIIAALATAGIAAGQKPHQGRGPGAAYLFEKLDANGDGAITLEEMRAHAQERRKAADLNGDGQVSPEEIELLHQERAAERFARIDANGDGVLSRDEVPDRYGHRFEKLDTNGDGVVSQSEMQSGKAGRHQGKHRGKTPEQAGKKSGPADPEARVQERFQRMDANGDGVITPDELQQGKVWRGKHRGPRE